MPDTSTTSRDAARPDAIAILLADFDAGKLAALARAVSIVENHRPGFDRPGRDVPEPALEMDQRI